MPDVPAARSALRILTHLARQSGPVPAATVARDLELPRSTTYQLIRVLQDEGYVVHYPELRAYGLGAFVSDIGSSVLRATRLARMAQPLIDRLVVDVGPEVPVVAQLAVLHGSDVSYVGKASGFRAPTTVSGIGVRLPAHLTATGRAMLARVSAAQVRALFPHRESLVTRHGVGPHTLGELDGILRDTRQRGFAVEEGDITPGYSSVAAAGLDHNGYPAAAIGLTYRAEGVGPHQVEALGDAVLAAASALTARLTGH